MLYSPETRKAKVLSNILYPLVFSYYILVAINMFI